MRCLRDLKELGYQTGTGMMIGSPGQTLETLWEDLEFIRRLRPEMIGIGPYLVPSRHALRGPEKTALLPGPCGCCLF